MNLDGSFRECSREILRLYGPQSVWTIAQSMGDSEGFEVEDEGNSDQGIGSRGRKEDSKHKPSSLQVSKPGLRLAGRWHPGLSDPVKASGPRTFACHHCWRVSYTSLVGYNGWNNFVTHLSGGLLYGREVERPSEEAPQRRKKRYVPHVRPAPRRDQVLSGLMQGLMYKEIAQRMGVAYGTVHMQVKKIYKLHDVHSRQELVKKVEAERSAVGDQRSA